MTNAVNVYMFANSGTEYAEYKVLKGTQSFGKLVSIEHDDLAVLDDSRVYLFTTVQVPNAGLFNVWTTGCA